VFSDLTETELVDAPENAKRAFLRILPEKRKM
jgi:hypothetical protein